LVLELSDSGTAVGLVTALQYVPVLLFAPWAGVVADRFDKRRLLTFTQALAGSQALLLGVVTATGAVELWMVYLAAALFGLITAFDNPTRQSFVMEMVGPTEVTNAVTLNSVTMNAARVVGPGGAGAILALVGTAPCFLFNAASYGAVIVALVAMDGSRLHRAPPVARAPRQLREGLRYVTTVPDLAVTLAMMTVIGAFAYEFQVILPIAAKYTFGGEAGTYALMTGAMGAGAVVGGLVTAGRPRTGLDVLGRTAMTFGAAIALVAISPTLPVAIAALLVTGSASVTFVSRANATVQLAAGPVMRGRVMALWTVSVIGTTPVGGPVIGWIGEHIGARWGLGVGAASAVGMGLWGRWQARRRAGVAPAAAVLAGAGTPPPAPPVELVVEPPTDGPGLPPGAPAPAPAPGTA